MSNKSMAGPPPFTITCEQPRAYPPSYDQSHEQSGAPPPMGWSTTAPGPSMAMPQPSTAGVHVYPQAGGVHGTHTNVNVYPQAHQQQQQQQQVMLGSSSVVYVSQHPRVIISNNHLSHHSAHLTCPSCRNVVNTRVQHSTASKTHLWALCLCLFGCWPCCLVPYCMNSCQNANHFCSNCGSYIGTGYD